MIYSTEHMMFIALKIGRQSNYSEMCDFRFFKRIICACVSNTSYDY